LTLTLPTTRPGKKERSWAERRKRRKKEKRKKQKAKKQKPLPSLSF
jgi:hypothetical protein